MSEPAEWTPDGAIRILSAEESWRLLKGASFGRIALSVFNRPEIFPINFYADGSSILLRTAEGTKLLELTINSAVALEADGYTEQDAWSVVAKGTATALHRQSEIFAADQLPLTPWIPTLKFVYVRIAVAEITGRAFLRGPEPTRY